MTSGGPATGDPDLVLQAVEGMPRALFVLDEQLRFRHVNAAAARALGSPAAQLVGRLIWDAFPHGVGSVYERTYHQVAATGVRATFEDHVARLDRWFRVEVFRTPAGLVVTYDDVTERHRVEQARDAALAERTAQAARAAAEAQAAERSGRHLMLVGEVSRTFTVDRDPARAVTRLAELCVPLLADWCLTGFVEGGRLLEVGRAHRDPALRAALDHYAELRVRLHRGEVPDVSALADGEPTVLQELTPAHLDALVPDRASRAALEVLRPAALAVVPVHRDGELMGVLLLVNGPERGAFGADELDTARIVAGRVAELLETGRLVRAQEQMTDRLQRSLLAAPAQPDHLQLAVRYRPATGGLSLGGDWYDSLLQPDGATVLVIGDVMGHDIEAAAAMGQVKTLVRGLAYDRHEEPAGVLRRADLAVVGLGIPTMATALVARVEQTPADRATGRRLLRWASAGHPDPLLLLADGTVVELPTPVGPPLGIGWRGPRADAIAELPTGSTLLMFTDGLFERRGVDLATGRARLAACLPPLAGLGVEELCARLVAALLDDQVEDDVALLAVRAHPVDRPRPLEAGPERLPGAP